MFKKTIEYSDWDGNVHVETFYFNMTKVELMENLTLQETLEKLVEDISGDERELKPAEIQRILDAVRTIMKLSYGVRSEDGKRFIKSDDVWEEFTQTAAYDAILMELFTTDDGAMSFIRGIIPPDLMNQVNAETEEPKRPKVPLDRLQKATTRELSTGSQES